MNPFATLTLTTFILIISGCSGMPIAGKNKNPSRAFLRSSNPPQSLNITSKNKNSTPAMNGIWRDRQPSYRTPQ